MVEKNGIHETQIVTTWYNFGFTRMHYSVSPGQHGGGWLLGRGSAGQGPVAVSGSVKNFELFLKPRRQRRQLSKSDFL